MSPPTSVREARARGGGARVFIRAACPAAPQWLSKCSVEIRTFGEKPAGTDRVQKRAATLEPARPRSPACSFRFFCMRVNFRASDFGILGLSGKALRAAAGARAHAGGSRQKPRTRGHAREAAEDAGATPVTQELCRGSAAPRGRAGRGAEVTRG